MNSKELKDYFVDLFWTMGQNNRWAEYKMINDKTLQKFKKKEHRIREWDEINNSKSYGTHFHEALYFLFTKTPPWFWYWESTPSQNINFDIAIFGNGMFCSDIDDIQINLSENIYLDDIIKAIESINIEELKKRFNIDEFIKENIFPYVWDDLEKNIWLKKLICEYNRLLKFYKNAKEKDAHVLIKLYGQPSYDEEYEKDGIWVSRGDIEKD